MAYNGDTTHYNGTNARQHTLQGTTITHNGVQWRHKALQWDRCATTYLARLLRNIRRFLMRWTALGQALGSTRHITTRWRGENAYAPRKAKQATHGEDEHFFERSCERDSQDKKAYRPPYAKCGGDRNSTKVSSITSLKKAYQPPYARCGGGDRDGTDVSSIDWAPRLSIDYFACKSC
jgi:hypothetical protein